MNDLKLRLKIKRKKPAFIRKRGKIYSKLGMKWRSPKGIHSKLRKHKKEGGNMPKSGYGSPRAVEGLHPSGFIDFIVYNPNDLKKIIPDKQACRIASSVGKKKKLEIMKKAEELKIKVLNPFKVENKK
ncbi:MAG: 50S ribosomal protein L32e [Candidatus Aenigmatarchaeota archaeon]